MDPKTITTDFELAAISAFKMEFPNVASKGCLFHLGQSILKRLGKLGLKTANSDNEGFNTWVKQIFAMALVPIEKVDELWETILETKPNLPNVEAFIGYFVDNYFEGSFQIEFLNHFNTSGPKINNHLERYNLRLKKFIDIAHPDIFEAI